ncbi:MFS general substrate transporter [Aspergillus ibericus CBS 121593]|uniref:MFS general substrate transporter n=1 Tax=Aspergillus ibericus CBS 121593 TaxID=1448316 RepID=A0A395HDB8_9EURO|nr:MFS general substrate transporter [Aspergillus ibericus CBS 121593]RAL05832.1 MFS general substrate transporter [Aspergillus ibericus CBS 121593]
MGGGAGSDEGAIRQDDVVAMDVVADEAMLIAGRTIQGVGAGGMYVLLDIVCADLVPLRERGKYLGLMFSWSGLAAALGPVVVGALAEANWRWIFYLNIPICAVALVAILLFMRVKSGAHPNHTSPLPSPPSRLDYLGTLIFIPSMISLLLGLIQGGVDHPWSSWHIITPLILGIMGWIIFHIQQTLTSTPSIPPHLFTTRTSATAYLLTFLSSILVQALSYFLPIYFQAVHATTVPRSGISFLPFAIGTLFFAVLAGTLLSVFGAYRPLHAIAFAFSAVSFGLLTLLDESSTTVEWVFYQLIAAVGAGMILSVLLPAIMAALPERDVAAATAAYSFVRTFGYIWGVTVASVVFDAVVGGELAGVRDARVRGELERGGAYAFASQMHGMKGVMGEDEWKVVVGVYVKGLRIVWWVGLGISCLRLGAVWMAKGLELRKELETEYGIDEGEKRGDTS